MCGICGTTGREDPALAERMLRTIRHRGPDSFDLAVSPTSSVGGCRLTIIGTNTSPLPRAGSPLVLFNGEIYNYRELAADLKVALDPMDAESHLVQHLLQTQGAQGIARLQGMFAIVAVEPDRIVLARDRLGIKPLFYATVNDEVVFGSEMKAILAHPDVSTALDEQALDETAVFGYISSPERTPFACIKQVPPGTIVEIAHGRHRVTQYWAPQLAESGETGDLGEWATAVRSQLRSGLAQMLEHDSLEKGFYLSGGVDSSLLAMLATESQARPVLTFTLADSNDSKDLVAARRIAESIGSDHYEFRVGLDEYLRELPVFVQHYENLIAGGVFDIHGGIAFQMLSRNVAKHVRVAFSGEGADELFGGYYWPYTHPLGFGETIRSRLAAAGCPPAVAMQVNELFPEAEDAAVYRRKVLDFLMQGALANYHLWSVDRSASAFGFEVRPAYLHDELVQLALSLPVEAKVLGNHTKRVLKEAARPLYERWGVADLLHRKKSGMPAAVHGIGAQFERLASGLVPEQDVATHPFARWVKSPVEAVMFDLFQYTFVQNRGTIPTGFEVRDFYESGARADMYR